MRRIATHAIPLLVGLVLAGTFVPSVSATDEGTPVASPEPVPSAALPAVGAPIEDIGSACNQDEFPAGESGISYQPLEDFGFVVPADAPDHNLYLTVSTLPPHSCMLFRRGTFGASTFYVLDGTLQFIAWSRMDTDIPVVKAGNEDDAEVIVPDESPVTLDDGDWVTVDRQAIYAYRNPSNLEARIIMAVYEGGAQRANGCVSGCRRHP